MKYSKFIGLTVLLCGLGASGWAVADKPLPGRGMGQPPGPPPTDRGFPHRDRHPRYSHSRIGVYLGVPLWPYYYYDPFYDPIPYRREIIRVPPPVPTVYIEKGESTTSEPSADSEYWYYCPSSKTYYPYVTECRDNWLKVVPSTPGD